MHPLFCRMILQLQPPSKLYALVDCDNFYVSCERVFQPELAKRPVIILSNNDGCVVARSVEAKALGIGMGEPFHHVKEIVTKENIKVFSSNYVLYGDLSRRVMDTLRAFSPDVEVYSIDEAFMVLPLTANTELLKKIREMVLKRTGIPVTIGLGETKTLSKLAMEYVKQIGCDGRVFDISVHTNKDEILSRVLVQDVWGIGLRYAEWLYKMGIKTADQLKNMDDKTIQRKAGVVGLRLLYELRGVPCLEMEMTQPPRKNITSSRSFGHYVTQLSDLEESVSTHAAMAGRKLRYDDSVAGSITVFITTNVYSKNPQYGKAASTSLIPSTDCDHELITAAKKVLYKIFKPGYRYIKAGVVLDELNPNDFRQTDIYSPRDYSKFERLFSAVDSTNQHFGGGTIHFLSTGIEKSWKMKMDYLSSRYTTRWEELAEVTA